MKLGQRYKNKKALANIEVCFNQGQQHNPENVAWDIWLTEPGCQYQHVLCSKSHYHKNVEPDTWSTKQL